MGQKVNPLALRLGINQDWRSRWFAKGNDLHLWIKEDLIIRRTLKQKLSDVFVGRVEIERQNDVISIFLWSSRLGVILGQKNKNVERIIFLLKKALKNRKYIIKIKVIEIRNSALNAQLVANDVAQKIANKQNYRQIQKQAIRSAVRLGAKGIKVSVAGRLNGAEIARREYLSEGKIPLSTLNANIDYGFSESKTNYGQIGVKVWIYHDIPNKQLPKQDIPSFSNRRT